MERRLGRDPFAQSGLDKFFTPVVEQSAKPAPKPRAVKAKPRAEASSEVDPPHASVADSSTSAKGLPEGWTRATFIVRQDLLRKVKRAAYWDRKQIKDVVAEALDAYLENKRTD